MVIGKNLVFLPKKKRTSNQKMQQTIAANFHVGLHMEQGKPVFLPMGQRTAR